MPHLGGRRRATRVVPGAGARTLVCGSGSSWPAPLLPDLGPLLRARCEASDAPGPLRPRPPEGGIMHLTGAMHGNTRSSGMSDRPDPLTPHSHRAGDLQVFA